MTFPYFMTVRGNLCNRKNRCLQAVRQRAVKASRAASSPITCGRQEVLTELRQPSSRFDFREREVETFDDQRHHLVNLRAGGDQRRRDDHTVAHCTHDEAVAEAVAAADHANA